MQSNIIYFTSLNHFPPCVQCSMTQSAFLSQLVQSVTTNMRRRELVFACVARLCARLAVTASQNRLRSCSKLCLHFLPCCLSSFTFGPVLLVIHSTHFRLECFGTFSFRFCMFCSNRYPLISIAIHTFCLDIREKRTTKSSYTLKQQIQSYETSCIVCVYVQR